jgi:hypothetical protein
VLLTIAIGGTLLARKYAEEPSQEETDAARLLEDAQDLEFEEDEVKRDTV